MPPCFCWYPMPRIPNYKRLLSQLLDAGFDDTAARVASAYTADVKAGIIKKRLDDLKVEAERLRELGEHLPPDNPYVRSLVTDLDAELMGYSRKMRAASTGIVEDATQKGGTWVRRTSFLGYEDQLPHVVARFNYVDPEAMKSYIDTITLTAWDDEIAQFAGNITTQVNDLIIREYVKGKNPLTVARTLAQQVPTFPQHQANTLMRTLQIKSFRDSTAAHQTANSDILQPYQIRTSALDGRVCLSCLAQHGDKIPLGSYVDDHHNGRCIGIAPVKALDEDFDMIRYVEGKPVLATTGTDYWNALPESRQRAMVGPEKHELLKTGKVQMRDFVHRYNDRVFGAMSGESSIAGLRLRGILT